MNRIGASAGAVLGAIALTLAVATASPARIDAGAALRSANFERPAATPVARPGSRAATRRALSGRALRARLRSRLRAAGGHSGAWVYDLTTKRGSVVFKSGASRRRVLASNSKLFTTAALLGRFGASHRFQTRLWLRGERAGTGGSVLHGSLALVGAGDPALASSSFAAHNGLPVTRLGVLTKRVAGAGIRRVTGKLLADPSVFDGRRSVPQPGITGGPFLSTLSGLSYNSGFGSSGYAKDPARRAGQALVRSLRKQGVSVGGGVRVGRVPARVTRKRRFAAVASPTVARLLAATNKPSNNFFAEMLLKRLAASGKHRGTTRLGARKAERFARSVGSGAKLINGSGLSRTNVASPREVGRLLVAGMRRDRLRKALPPSLAVAGRDGTLAGRMRGTAAEGRCSGKTGTLDGISALSGYCTRFGHTYAFSILMNGVEISAAQGAQDAMVAAIARYKP